MGVERQVISKTLDRKGRWGDAFHFDFSHVQIGDWFIASGAARVRRSKLMVGKIDMEFEQEPHREFSVKFTRIA